MKIAHVFWSFTIGGAETMLIDIVNQQVVDGNIVTLIIVNDQYSQDLLSVLNSKTNLVLLKRHPGSRNPYFLLKLNLILFSLSPEVIHCHNYSLEKIILSHFLKRSILTIHGFNRPITSKTKFNHIVAISNVIQKDLIQKGINNLSVVFNGVEINLIEKKKLFNSEIQIVCVGRLEHQIKGQHNLITAFSFLKREFKAVKLHFVGQGPSKEYLKALIEELKLENDIVFHGSKSRGELYETLKDFDILVQPSIHEGFGLAVVEGMIAQIPIIISNASGLLEVTESGRFAQYVVVDNDPFDYYKSLIDTICKIEQLDRSFIHKLESARKYAAKNFSIHNTCVNYQKIYNKVSGL